MFFAQTTQRHKVVQRSDVIFLLMREVGNLYCAENVRYLALADPIKGGGGPGMLATGRISFTFMQFSKKKLARK